MSAKRTVMPVPPKLRVRAEKVYSAVKYLGAPGYYAVAEHQAEALQEEISRHNERSITDYLDARREKLAAIEDAFPVAARRESDEMSLDDLEVII